MTGELAQGKRDFKAHKMAGAADSEKSAQEMSVMIVTTKTAMQQRCKNQQDPGSTNSGCGYLGAQGPRATVLGCHLGISAAMPRAYHLA
jgi:hypothetical protein